MTAILLYRHTLGEDSCKGIAENSTKGLKAVLNNNIPVSDIVFRWGTTSTLPGNPKVINKAKAIHYVFDKKKSRKDFADKGFAPKTWVDFGDYLDTHNESHVIVRKNEHSRSEHLHFCQTMKEVYEACDKYESYYISEYIKKDHEYRVFIVSGRVIAVLEKHPASKDEDSWGCVPEEGAVFFKYVDWTSWNTRMIETALGAFKMTDLDFGAVDMMTKGTDSYVLEINTGPQLTPYYMKKFAQAFDYIIENGRDVIPVSGSTWKHLIHPATSSEAIV